MAELSRKPMNKPTRTTSVVVDDPEMTLKEFVRRYNVGRDGPRNFFVSTTDTPTSYRFIVELGDTLDQGASLHSVFDGLKEHSSIFIHKDYLETTIGAIQYFNKINGDFSLASKYINRLHQKHTIYDPNFANVVLYALSHNKSVSISIDNYLNVVLFGDEPKHEISNCMDVGDLKKFVMTYKSPPLTWKERFDLTPETITLFSDNLRLPKDRRYKTDSGLEFSLNGNFFYMEGVGLPLTHSELLTNTSNDFFGKMKIAKEIASSLKISNFSTMKNFIDVHFSVELLKTTTVDAFKAIGEKMKSMLSEQAATQTIKVVSSSPEKFVARIGRKKMQIDLSKIPVYTPSNHETIEINFNNGERSLREPFFFSPDTPIADIATFVKEKNKSSYCSGIIASDEPGFVPINLNIYETAVKLGNREGLSQMFRQNSAGVCRLMTINDISNFAKESDDFSYLSRLINIYDRNIKRPPTVNDAKTLLTLAAHCPYMIRAHLTTFLYESLDVLLKDMSSGDVLKFVKTFGRPPLHLDEVTLCQPRTVELFADKKVLLDRVEYVVQTPDNKDIPMTILANKNIETLTVTASAKTMILKMTDGIVQKNDLETFASKVDFVTNFTKNNPEFNSAVRSIASSKTISSYTAADKAENIRNGVKKVLFDIENVKPMKIKDYEVLTKTIVHYLKPDNGRSPRTISGTIDNDRFVLGVGKIKIVFHKNGPDVAVKLLVQERVFD